MRRGRLAPRDYNHQRNIVHKNGRCAATVLKSPLVGEDVHRSRTCRTDRMAKVNHQRRHPTRRFDSNRPKRRGAVSPRQGVRLDSVGREDAFSSKKLMKLLYALLIIVMLLIAGRMQAEDEAMERQQWQEWQTLVSQQDMSGGE